MITERDYFQSLDPYDSEEFLPIKTGDLVRIVNMEAALAHLNNNNPHNLTTSEMLENAVLVAYSINRFRNQVNLCAYGQGIVFGSIPMEYVEAL